MYMHSRIFPLKLRNLRVTQPSLLRNRILHYCWRERWVKDSKSQSFLINTSSISPLLRYSYRVRILFSQELFSFPDYVVGVINGLWKWHISNCCCYRFRSLRTKNHGIQLALWASRYLNCPFSMSVYNNTAASTAFAATVSTWLLLISYYCCFIYSVLSTFFD